MIIDCHGHYTTAPPQLQDYRDAQIEHFNDPSRSLPSLKNVSDDEVRQSIENNQLQALRERGVDMTIFSPKASTMAHHIGDETVSKAWTRINNDLIHRVTRLFPDHFIGVCQLPQSVNVPIKNSIEELERCVLELGFVGCNLNPDPSGGHWQGPPLTDRAWYPFFEKMVELDIPAMIHVSGSCNVNFHATGAHYINADTTAFMQLLQGDLFHDFPDLRLIIPHGGGAVPYHWGRYRGLADMLERPPLTEHIMRNVSFDTCVYHQAGIDLLFRVIDIENILFASEMFGAVKGIDPLSGFNFDDTKRYIDALELSEADRYKVFEGNARRVYPRLDAALKARGK
ncbi:amidohydrolase [Pseudomonas agarici]|uniref:amidohydrolase family protein n=1 Tax=Pseudomonas agarici TaxID=46677 RepID=UPI00031E6886|nr:amidohydrolase family protein [Pseudomonas agarici]NWC07813.1 amidohydrolase [Pseudomonas agarici]SEK75173.1 4-oxalomesaconate hydratase [Pseudomonas agarici]